MFVRNWNVVDHWRHVERIVEADKVIAHFCSRLGEPGEIFYLKDGEDTTLADIPWDAWLVCVEMCKDAIVFVSLDVFDRYNLADNELLSGRLYICHCVDTVSEEEDSDIDSEPEEEPDPASIPLPPSPEEDNEPEVG